jgi:hypothetical protein
MSISADAEASLPGGNANKELPTQGSNGQYIAKE